MSRILSIDYGLVRCGLAVTDMDKIIAQPLTTVPAASLIHFIKQYVQSNKVEKIIIGFPLSMDGKENEMTHLIDIQIEKLKKIFPPILIEKFDERFTSRLAKHALIESHQPMKKRKNKHNIDMVAATIMLQLYLEQKKG